MTSDPYGDLERRLVTAQQRPAKDEAWALYSEATLPDGLDPRASAMIRQGFDAGYTLAMEAIRMAIEIEREANR